MKEKHLQETDLEKLESFLEECVELSEDELRALDKQCQMNYELFKRLMKKLVEIDSPESFMQLCSDYPEYVDRFHKEEIDEDV